MAKRLVGGKYVNVKTGIKHNYKFVGILSNGEKVVGALVQADSVREGTAKAKEMGYKEVVKGSMVIDTKFNSILENPKSDKPVENWSSDDWKRRKAQKN